MEYVGGQFFGNENEAPTKTLLSFFLSSLHGSYEDLVCFVPMTSLTSSSLLQHFNEVLAKLLGIGFDVKLVLTDGHKTNIKFFTELGKGALELCIQTHLSSQCSIQSTSSKTSITTSRGTGVLLIKMS